MTKTPRTEYWEIDPLDGLPSESWMLVDRHRDCRVIAGNGVFARKPGQCLNELFDQTQGLSDWLEAQCRDPKTEVLLLPLSGEIWFLLTHFYLSTGYWLLVHLPASDGDSLSLACSGKMGAIALFPKMPDALPRERDFDAYSSLAWWETVCECLPYPTIAENEREEIESVLQAVAQFYGIRVTPTEAYGVLPGSAGIASGQTDLCMLSVMLMLIFHALTDCGVSRVSFCCEGMEEGYALILDAVGLAESAHPEEATAMKECRELAERNGQIFACSTLDRVMRLTLCAVRKDYALLGVKIPSYHYE